VPTRDLILELIDFIDDDIEQIKSLEEINFLISIKY
jgi:hypothetical protein